MQKFFLKSFVVILLLISNPCFGGVDFDGIDDFIDVGTMGDFGSTMDTNNIFISIWVKTTNGTDASRFIGIVNDGTNTSFQISINLNSSVAIAQGALRLYLRDDDGNILDGSEDDDTGVTDGNWHHVLFKAKGNAPSNITIWVDGEQQSTTYRQQQDVDNTSDFEYDLYMGARNLRDVPDNFFSGEINEFAIWKLNGNSDLTASEISLLASSRAKRLPLQIQPTYLVAYWPLDDEPDGTSGDGDNFQDLTGNGNNGTGNDGANNTGLTAKAEEVLTYP